MKVKWRKVISIFMSVVMLFSLLQFKGITAMAGTGPEGMNGSGTLDDPYIIMTPVQLNEVRNNLSAHYKLGSDINLSGYTNWVPIGNYTNPFIGTFDGDGYKIDNLNISASISAPENGCIGLFGLVSSSIDFPFAIQYLEIASGSINVSSTSSFPTGAGIVVGAFAGQCSGIISNCSNRINITASQATDAGAGINVGGIVGNAQYNVKNCFNAGNISATIPFSAGTQQGDVVVGGIAGYGNVKVSFCYNIGAVSGSSSRIYGHTYLGGILGRTGAGSAGTYCHFLSEGSTNSGLKSIGNGNTDADVVGETSAVLKTQSTFSNWDFSRMWSINSSNNNGYPNLQPPFPSVPLITTQPQNSSKIAGQSATFSVAAELPKDGTLSYQWEKSTDDGATWTGISGATSLSCTIPSLTVADNNVTRYHCVVTNTSTRFGNSSNNISNPAMLSVYADSAQGGFNGKINSVATPGVTLSGPCGVAADSSGNIYIADSSNNVIRKVDTSGNISTVAGGGADSSVTFSGLATNAVLNFPMAVHADNVGNIYIADTNNNVIRKVDTSGNISTVAGGGADSSATFSGAATGVSLSFPYDVAVDGNNIYIADSSSNVIRKVDTSGNISTVAGGGANSSATYSGVATGAILNYPSGIAVDSSHNIYIADSNNNVIRKVDISGNISTVAGTGIGGYNGDNRLAVSAQLNYPSGIAIDGSNNLYFADGGNSLVRKIRSDGIISTVAGRVTTEMGYSGDGAAATDAQFNCLNTVAVDSTGNIYIADCNNNRIRKVWYGCTVTFDKNGGDANATPATADASTGGTVALPTTNPTRAGYTFLGWNTNASGSGTAFTASTAVTADITVYAQWSQDTYTVTFNKNGGDTNATPGTATATYNKTVALPTTNPSRLGYTFLSWNTKADGSGTAFTASTAVTASVTVYAQWLKNSNPLGENDKTIIGAKTPNVSDSYTASIRPEDTTGKGNVTVSIGKVEVNTSSSVFKNIFGNDTSSYLKLSQTPSQNETYSGAAILAGKSNSIVTTIDVTLFKVSSDGSSTAIHQLGDYVKVTIKLTQEQMASIKDAATAKLYYYNIGTNALIDMNAVFDLTAGTASFYTNHFSTFVVVQPTGLSSKGATPNPNTEGGNIPMVPIALFTIGLVYSLVIVKKRFKLKKAEKAAK